MKSSDANRTLGEMFGRWGVEAAKQELRAERAEAERDRLAEFLGRLRAVETSPIWREDMDAVLASLEAKTEDLR